MTPLRTPLGTRPWLRAPLLLVRHPAVFLAIVAATAVLSIAASSGVLFVSTLDTASLESQAAQDCPERSMPGFSADVPPQQLGRYQSAGLRIMGSAMRGQRAGAPYSVAIGWTQVQQVTLTLYHRPGALQHVRRLRGAGGPGVWMPDNYARQLHVTPGGFMTTVDGGRIRVAGIYASLAPSPFKLANVSRYLCTWSDLIIRRLTEQGTGPFVISDRATIEHAANQAQAEVFAPLPYGSTSLSQARSANRRGAAAGRAFFATQGSATLPTASPAGVAPPSANTTALAHMIERAGVARSGVSGSVLPIDLAGVLVAALLVAGAGAYWATHREREIRLLVSRGVGPGWLAVKAVLEALPAALVGLVGGVAAGVAIGKAVSPSSVLGPGAAVTGAWTALIAVGGGLVLIGVSGAVAARDRVIRAPARWLRLAPWELLVVVPALVTWLRVRGAQAVDVRYAIVHVRPALVVYPMLTSVAVLLVLGRVLALAMPMLRRRSRGGGPAWYLALRRLAGSRALAVGLALCVALPGALLTYTASLTSSVQGEVAAKYRTNIGAERVLDVIGVGAGTTDLGGAGSLVSSYTVSPRLPGDVQVSVLGVQPASFARFALLDDGQRSLVRRLHGVSSGPVPAILVHAPHGTAASRLSILTSRIPLDVVGTSDVFPGLRDGTSPLVVVDRSALAHVDPNADRLNQVWTTEALDPTVRGELARHHDSVLDTVSPKLLIDSGGLLPVTWIFSYLRALAYLVGLLAIVALVYSLAARTRRRTVSYVMSRRMGLARSAHLRSLLLEIGVVVGLGYVAGVLVGTGSFGLILDALDVYPTLPPPAALVLPVPVWLVTAGIWVAVIVAAAGGMQLLADRARPAEILRLE